ncbi:MAG: hypothetical protein ACR2IS_17095, partial [Nitrososphaeraceae archaeon]
TNPSFLNTKVKDPGQDPERGWITTWNHYLNRIKLFFRWLYNCKGKGVDGKEISQSEYETLNLLK